MWPEGSLKQLRLPGVEGDNGWCCMRIFIQWGSYCGHKLWVRTDIRIGVKTLTDLGR